MRYTVAQIAHMIGGIVEGHEDTVITAMSRIEDAQESSITFISNEKYIHFLENPTIGAVLVPMTFDTALYPDHTYIKVNDVAGTIQSMLAMQAKKDSKPQISTTAVISSDATIGADAQIGDFVVIESGVVIGDGVCIDHHCVVARDVTLGNNVTLASGVRIEKACVVGSNCVIQNNSVIGSDGFGFKPNEVGVYSKIPHIGNVEIGDHVEIGANVCIDRAVMGSTVIEEGVKLDNLIHIAHNVRIAKHTVIAAQAGIAGSTTIGAYSMIGGQVGIVGHIEVEEKSMIQAKSGVMSNHRGEKKLFGYPAIAYGDYLKSYAIFKKLPQLYKEIAALKKQAEK